MRGAHDDPLGARCRDLRRRLQAWKAKPEAEWTVAEAEDILDALLEALEAADVRAVTGFLFDVTVAAHLEDEAGLAAGVLEGAAEFFYRIGGACLDKRIAWTLTGDLLRQAHGGDGQLAGQIPRAKVPFADIEADALNRLILAGDMLTSRDRGTWADKIPHAISERTLRRWAEDVPPEAREMARLIGLKAACQKPLDEEECAFEDYHTRWSRKQLVAIVANPPRRPRR